jgi:hypothetical protein
MVYPRRNALVVGKCILVAFLFLQGGLLFAFDNSLIGTYSSLKFNKEGGDLLGYEILIIPTDLGFRAIVQIAEGAPGNVYVLDATVKGDELRFRVPLNNGVEELFVGHLKDGFLIGVFSTPNSAKSVKLKKGRSYWDR